MPEHYRSSNGCPLLIISTEELIADSTHHMGTSRLTPNPVHENHQPFVMTVLICPMSVGVTADLFGPPGPYPLADLDPTVQIR